MGLLTGSERARLHWGRLKGMLPWMRQAEPVAKRPDPPRPVPAAGPSVGQVTPERARKAADGTLTIGRQTKVQQFQSHIDRLAEHLTFPERDAAEWFYELAYRASAQKITAAYSGKGVDGSGGAQDAHISHQQRLSYVEFQAVVEQLGPSHLALARELVLEEKPAGASAPRRLEAIASDYCAYSDEPRLRGVAVGLVKAVLWRLMEIRQSNPAISRKKRTKTKAYKLEIT